MPEPFINLKSAADYLGYKPRTILKFIDDARAGCDLPIPYYQDGRGSRLLFLESELLRWRRDKRISREISTRVVI